MVLAVGVGLSEFQYQHPTCLEIYYNNEMDESPVSKSRFNNPPKETSGSAFTIAMSFQVLVYSLHDLSEARKLWLGSSKHQHRLPLGFAAAPEPLWQSPPATCHQQKWWWTPSGVNHVWETSSWYVFKILLGVSVPLSAMSTKETKHSSGNVSLQTNSVPFRVWSFSFQIPTMRG